MYTCIYCGEVITWYRPVVYMGRDSWVHVLCFTPYIERYPRVGRMLQRGMVDVVGEINRE